MIVSEIATQVRTRIPVSEIRSEDYVSTDNMRPYFGGIEPSLSVPPTGTVTGVYLSTCELSRKQYLWRLHIRKIEIKTTG